MCCEVVLLSLSARRAWIEIVESGELVKQFDVALRKESVDRNTLNGKAVVNARVALRKESVDRNYIFSGGALSGSVALRKESVDRNS